MDPSLDVLLDLHRRMVRIRHFEESAGRLAEQNRLPGFLHLYVGEEAVASGVCANLDDDDQISSTHRGHGHLVAKGGDYGFMMAELMGKSTGYCGGKGGSMHICDLDLGMLGANGIVVFFCEPRSPWQRPTNELLPDGSPKAPASTSGSCGSRSSRTTSTTCPADSTTGHQHTTSTLNSLASTGRACPPSSQQKTKGLILLS